METVKVLVDGIEEELFTDILDEEIENNDDLFDFNEDTIQLDNVVAEIKKSGEKDE